MKKILFTITLLVSFLNGNSQTNAITSEGEEVILYDDGSWSYKINKKINLDKIETNSDLFRKDTKSTFLVKSNKSKAGVYINPSKWSFKKADDDNNDAEYTFELRDQDLYGQIITERIEIPLESLQTIAIENFKSVASDAKIVKSEYRNVNSARVLMIHMEGTSQGIPVFFYGYYSNAGGTNQLVLWSMKSLYNEYFEEIQEFLNGLVSL